ncbi:MAG: thioesterase family protein [Chloroflexota bacterium]|nr:thioesterase family protein [Chloroflexota bacterium]
MPSDGQPRPGLIGEAETIVDRAQLASSYGSGLIDVFATPAMIALMEQAAQASVEHVLAPGATSVGTHVEVRHLAATPLGMHVRARAELIEVDGRRLLFRVSAADAVETIGQGTHERAIVDSARLLARASAKSATPQQG